MKTFFYALLIAFGSFSFANPVFALSGGDDEIKLLQDAWTKYQSVPVCVENHDASKTINSVLVEKIEKVVGSAPVKINMSEVVTNGSELCITITKQ